MSADVHAIPGHADTGRVDMGHDASDHGGAGHGTLQGYLTGFVLSVVLTAIPFWLVMGHVFKNSLLTGALVMTLAAIQVVVHMVFFLHMTTKSEGGWSLLALMFTLVLLGIVLSGSIWVMYHLNANMMPNMTRHDMRQMP